MRLQWIYRSTKQADAVFQFKHLNLFVLNIAQISQKLRKCKTTLFISKQSKANQNERKLCRFVRVWQILEPECWYFVNGHAIAMNQSTFAFTRLAFFLEACTTAHGIDRGVYTFRNCASPCDHITIRALQFFMTESWECIIIFVAVCKRILHITITIFYEMYLWVGRT